MTRVFYIGETVPAGTFVLNNVGEMFFLDGTADCDITKPGRVCPECSYDVTNLYSNPLVEVQLPDYAQEVTAEYARRQAMSKWLAT